MGFFDSIAHGFEDLGKGIVNVANDVGHVAGDVGNVVVDMVTDPHNIPVVGEAISVGEAAGALITGHPDQAGQHMIQAGVGLAADLIPPPLMPGKGAVARTLASTVSHQITRTAETAIATQPVRQIENMAARQAEEAVAATATREAAPVAATHAVPASSEVVRRNTITRAETEALDSTAHATVRRETQAVVEATENQVARSTGRVLTNAEKRSTARAFGRAFATHTVSNVAIGTALQELMPPPQTETGLQLIDGDAHPEIDIQENQTHPPWTKIIPYAAAAALALRGETITQRIVSGSMGYFSTWYLLTHTSFADNFLPK